MGRFADALTSPRFIVTAEIGPPKGVDVAGVLKEARSLAGHVTALNVTDAQASRMRLSALALSHLLLDEGIEPVFQITGRDRNSIAVQSDLLGAYVLGIRNVLCLSGDPVQTGDHPNAKPVFELDSVALVKTAKTLQQGADLSGNPLSGAPSFVVGCALTPSARPLEKEVEKTRQKVELGTDFYQTQAVYDPEEFRSFYQAIAPMKPAPILIGIVLLKSGRQARFMNEKIPGIHVPEETIEEIDRAADKRAASVDIAARTIRGVKDLCRGAHIMAQGWEEEIPHILQAAGIG